MIRKLKKEFRHNMVEEIINPESPMGPGMLVI
jgi:hypothetical protein